MVAEGDTRSSAEPGQPTGKGGVSLNGPKFWAREGTAWHAQDLPHLRVTPLTLPVPSCTQAQGDTVISRSSAPSLLFLQSSVSPAEKHGKQPGPQAPAAAGAELLPRAKTTDFHEIQQR